jgi:predicted nucleic acid-binding protein
MVAALFNEKRTQDAQSWLGSQEISSLWISDWTLTEVSSAMSIKLRSKEITLEQRALALAAFNQIVEESFSIMSVTKTHFQQAAQFAGQYSTGLRAGDALHLAIASTHGAIVVTLDRVFADAGPKVGTPTQLL